MKKINLIKRLWTDSHEKQSPQRFVRYAAMLIMLLTLGLGQVWATDLYVRGAHNSWGTGQQMTGTSTPWTNIAYWGSNAEFKISTSDWSLPNLGGKDSKLSLSWNTKSGALHNDGGSNNIYFPALPTGGGIVKLTVTLSSSKYYIQADKLVEEGNDWKDITDPTIYFDNSAASYSNVSVVMGRVWDYGGQSQGYKAVTLSNITNTSLYYTQGIDNASGDASKYTTMLFANASMSGWTASKQATEGVVGKTSYTNTYNDNLNSNTFLFKAASGEKGAALTKTDLTSYTDLNKTQTIQVRISEDNGANYSNAAFASWPGSITVARTYMSSATASSSPSATAMTAATTSAALTSSITFTGANTTEYTFAGWSNSSTGPDGNTSKTYTITGAVTKYAFYKRKQYTLSYGVNSSTRYGSITLNSGSAVTTTSSSTLNHGTSISFTASANSGYQVEGWYSDASCTVGNRLQSGGNSYDAGTLTAAKTVYVKFEEKTGGIITLSAGANGQVSADNSSWGSTKYISDITTATDVNIYAKGNTGYQFSSWTKSSGSGTIKTNAASGVFTTVAYEDATVTASFSEIMRSITISGGHVYGGASTSTTAGVATSAKITANAPAAGKKFTGWSLGAGVSLKGGYALTDQTIEIYSTANATVTATYADRAQVKMYFAKPPVWGNSTFYVHTFKNGGGVDPNATYPGVECTTTETINCVTYYTYQYYTEGDGIGGSATGNSAWDRVIFGCNNDAKKTGDLTISNGHYYYWNSTTTGAASAVSDVWYIKGTMNAWGTSDPIVHDCANHKGTASINLTKGTTYEFKVYDVINTKMWSNSAACGGENKITETMPSAVTLYNNDENVMKITANVTGPYTFEVSNTNTTSPKIKVTFPTSYTLTYSIGSVVGTSGSISTSPTTASGSKVLEGSTVTLTAPAAKTGYTWKGWYTNAAGTEGKIADESRAITVTMNADKTLYACYTINNHAITHSASMHGSYTIQVGDASAVSTNTTSDYGKTITLAADPDDGYHFGSWSAYKTETPATTVTVTSNQFTMPDYPVTVGATFTPNNYTITLNDNEGSGGVGSATVTFDDNNFAFASSFVAPTRTGYIFQGYFNSSDMEYGEKFIDVDGTWHADKSNYYIDASGNWVYPNNYTLYAGWTPITYTVTYHANGGSAKDEQTDPTVTNWTYGVAQYISVPSSYFNAPTNYTLYSPYWNDSEHGVGTDYECEERSNLTSTNGDNIDLYAQWYLQITLDKNDEDATNNGSMRVRYNQPVTYNKDILPSRVGYHRTGFYTASEDGTKAFEADGTMVSGDVSGYIDDGYWIYTFDDPSDPYPTFYTHWDQNHYDLTFDANDCAAYVGTATGSKASVADVAYETYVDITAGTLAREGYTFSGWSKTACATSATYMGDTWRRISHVDGDDVTLYAVWSPNTYTISFNGQGAYYVGEASRSIRMGDNYGTRDGYTSSLPTASKSGYEFLGWYTRPNGAGTHITDETQMTTASDHTLYAYWAKASRVYFKNTLGWESVYVTWDATWNYNSEDKGAGAKGKTQELMSHIYGTDIWYKDIPAAILSSWKGNLAFTNIAMPNYEWFDDGQAVYRRDFDSDATMFVPTPNDPNKYTKNKHDAKPGTVYYSTDMIVDKDKDENVTNYRYKNGYWVRYDELQSGYTVKGSWAWDDDHYVERHSLNDSTYVFTIRNLAANTDYWFNLYKHCTTDNDYSSVFKPAADMTSASSDVVFSAQYAGGGDKKMTTTVAGDYTFKFVFSRLGEIRLTIEYPLAVNDYRVVYSYTKGGAQTFASEYIKAKADAVDTISMFIHSADSATARSLYIQKCTGISAGVPTWNTTYSAITLPSETASGKTSGVYNFRIAQNGSAAATGESIGKYDGNYYIRTDSAAGGWDFYKEYPSSQMTFSEYSLSQTLSAPYSHYYCQYVGNSSTDISYTIATDYSPAICPVLTGDATIGVGNKTLPSGKPASVRFTWNEETNATFRSYLKSAQGEGNKRFLVLHGSDNKVLDADGNTIAGEGAGAEQMHANELLFSDTENWVYELAFKAKPGAKVSIIARYNDVDRYLVGKADAWETIISSSAAADSKYNIAAVYDFKTNRLITTWVPSGTISDQIEEVDVLIERHNQDGATTITFGRAAVDADAGSISAKRVIGALRFDYNELVGRVASWTPDTRAKMMFFVSFPFDVNVSDIFGLNTNYGEAFIVQGYNGAKRAEKGFFKGDGTDTFWETLPVDTVMHAGVGYVVTLDNDYFNGDVGHIWDNKRAGDHVYMYFPSANDPEHPVIINSDAKTINVPAHLCTINRTFNSGKLNHKYTDSNWNLMGVPIFQNHTGDDGIAGTPGAIFTASKEPSDTTEYANPENPTFGYFYEWHTDKTYTIAKADGFTFKPMHSYMVQYAGNVKFTCAEPVVPSLAPRRTAMKENYNIELQVLNNSGDMLNHTYVELRENACDTFALNEDTYMMSSNKAVSVYTFAGTYDVAANVLSIGSHVVPVGVIVKQAGTYTFTMPSNFSGTVTLVDTYAQTRTNLNIEDYEVSLPKGTDEERFYLEININKVPTAIDGAKVGEGTLKDGKVHKFIMNDQMYILKDGLLYDARGNRVK